MVLDSLRPQARGKPLEALLRGLAGEDERDRVGNGTLRLDLDRDDAPVPVDDRADELGGGLGLEGALRQGLPPPGDAMVNAAQLRCPVPGVEAPQFGSRRQTGRLDPHERSLHAGRLRDPRAVVRRIFGDAAQEAVGRTSMGSSGEKSEYSPEHWKRSMRSATSVTFWASPAFTASPKKWSNPPSKYVSAWSSVINCW